MERKKTGAIVCSAVMLLSVFAGCGGKTVEEPDGAAPIQQAETVEMTGQSAPEHIALDTSAVILLPGETWDAAAHTDLTGTGALSYASGSEEVASVSGEGIITAWKEGITAITVSAAADPSVSASLDLLVCEYDTVFTGEKYIEGMGCDIHLRLRLNSDGTFDFYRYPMVVSLAGGGVMPDQIDSGTYTFEESRIAFESESLGQFAMDLRSEGGAGVYLQGEMPTGGARTQMRLDRNTASGGTENGCYSACAVTAEGEDVYLSLTLENGEYRMTGTLEEEETLISEGSYTLNASHVEFWAEYGANFGADYDAFRQAVEGTQIPVTADGYDSMVAVTLERNAE